MNASTNFQNIYSGTTEWYEAVFSFTREVFKLLTRRSLGGATELGASRHKSSCLLRISQYFMY
jgi:hypothetical protein